MLTRVCLICALLGAIPALPQAVPSATIDSGMASDGTQMRKPPPVSGETYPTETGAETRSNQIGAGLTFSGAYNDNVFAGSNVSPISDVTYSIGSSLSLDQSTARMHDSLKYSPGFTIYQRTSALNASDQNASLDLLYRLSPHISVGLVDAFHKSSNVFNQINAGVPGSTQSPTTAVVAPFADQLNNTGGASVSYQFSKNGMVGGGVASTIVKYSNPANALGLSNSNTRGGSAFYNVRLSRAQYAGAQYQYSRMVADVANSSSDTRVHTIYAFYTIYLESALSLSISGGPQHFEVTQSLLPRSHNWTPSVTASMGWQKERVNLAASYSRTVTGAGGLLGAFHSNSASASVRWQLLRTWTAGASANYEIQKNLYPVPLQSNPGGHSISGGVSVEHRIGEHLLATLGYQRLHQSYSGVAAVSSAPDSNREFISVSYQFTRPIGR